MASVKTLWNGSASRSLSLNSTVRPLTSRSFSSCVARQLNPLLNLSAFSGSKEAQYLSKERRIPRTEFAPHLELIRASEVDPFAPTAGASPTVIAALRQAQNGESDRQTAYALAITNLVQQLEESRQDVRQTNESLIKLQREYKKNERDGLLMSLFLIGMCSLFAFKPALFSDIGDYFKDHKMTRKLSHTDRDTRDKTTTPNKPSQHRLLELATAKPLHGKTVKAPEPPKDDATQSNKSISQHHKTSNTPPSFMSRLFWAHPN